MAQIDESNAAADKGSKLATETHEVAQRKLEQMDKLKSALGISAEGKEGDAFNRDLQVTDRAHWMCPQNKLAPCVRLIGWRHRAPCSVLHSLSQEQKKQQMIAEREERDRAREEAIKKREKEAKKREKERKKIENERKKMEKKAAKVREATVEVGQDVDD